MSVKTELMNATNETVSALVDRLVDASAREDEELDYKQALTLATDDQKLELARDVSAFANGRGGHLVFGVREKRSGSETTGEPEAVVGLTLNPDKVERQLLDILDAHVQPRAPGLRVRIGAVTTGHVLVISVPRSWCAPHRVSDGTFWVRQGARKRQFDVQELRTAFVGGEEFITKTRRFREERLARLVASDTPVPVTAGAFVLLHLIPLVGFEGRFQTDFGFVSKDEAKLLPSRSLIQHWQSRFNVDGFVYALWPEKKEGAIEFVQVFRSGAIEYVDAHTADFPKVTGCLLETRVLLALKAHMSVLEEQGAARPFVVFLSLHGVEGRKLVDTTYDHRPWEDPFKFDRDTVLLPDVMLVDDGRSIEDVMKPVFDVMWQAAGWPGSRGYDAQGKFLPERHRG